MEREPVDQVTEATLWQRFKELALDPGADRSFNLGGHYDSLGAIDDLFAEGQCLCDRDAITKVPALIAAMERGTCVSAEEAIRLRFGNHCPTCFYCGEAAAFRFDGQELRAEMPCPLELPPDGEAFELNVPSGVLVIGEDFTDLFRLPGERHHADALKNQIQISRQQAAAGSVRLFLNRARLGIRRQPPNPQRHLALADTKTHPHENDPQEIPVSWNGRPCPTQIWIADRAEYERRSGPLTTDGLSAVEVDPGVYRITHHLYRRARTGEPRPVNLASITWVRAPDAIRDFLAEEAALDLRAEQVFFSLQRRWPRLYRNAYAPVNAADRMLAAAAVRDWRPKGCCQLDPDSTNTDPDLPFPTFAETVIDGLPPQQWPCLSQDFAGSALARGARGELPFNPSFAALARNVLACIARHGIEASFAGDEEKAEQEAEMRVQARELLAQLNERYP